MNDLIPAKLHKIAQKRCEQCPAFWSNVFWGEGDAGCQLDRDISEFCRLSLLPKVVVRRTVKAQMRKKVALWMLDQEIKAGNFDTDPEPIPDLLKIAVESLESISNYSADTGSKMAASEALKIIKRKVESPNEQ